MHAPIPLPAINPYAAAWHAFATNPILYIVTRPSLVSAESSSMNAIPNLAIARQQTH